MRRAPSSRRRGFFERLVALLVYGGDPDAEKRRQLHLIERQLHSTRQRFYNPRKRQALPGMASFFHAIYKQLALAQNLVGRAESSQLLRNLLVESAFTDAQKKLYEGFQEEAIAARAKDRDAQVLAAELKEEMAAFVGGFDSQRVKTINQNYAHLMAFLDLVRFDFFFFLHKFDSSLTEGGFSGNPRFEAIAASYVIDDLKELWDIILALDTTADWAPLLDVLKGYRDVEVVSREGWRRVLQALSQLKRSRVLELIVKHAEEDPDYRPRPAAYTERIVDSYVQKLRTQVELVSQKVIAEVRGKRIEELVHSVFGGETVQALQHYTERASAELRRSVVAGYLHAAALNYLAAYLREHFEKEMRPAVDLLLIKGKWAASAVSQHVSEALHRVLAARDRLAKLDEDLAPEGDVGAKIAAMVLRSERDRAVRGELRKILEEVNTSAREILVAALQNLVLLGRNFKTLIEDRGRKPSEIILNWRELDPEMGTREAMAAAYKRLYQLVQLVQQLAKA